MKFNADLLLIWLNGASIKMQKYQLGAMPENKQGI